MGETVGGRACENHNKQTHPRETGEKREDQKWVGQQFTRKTRACSGDERFVFIRTSVTQYRGWIAEMYENTFDTTEM
jgi:ribosomal protein L44E